MATTKEQIAADAVIDLSVARRLAMVVMGYIPLLHVSATVALIVLPLCGYAPLWVIALAPACLYLLPPLVVRLTLLVFPIADGRFRLTDAEFLRWWFTAQWQIVFNRLPMLEEILRLVPSCYSLWLRLWGAKVGALVYWSPGCIVLDRSFVDIGSRVVIGAAARLHSHLIMQSGGKTSLVIARITIGDDALVGGLSLVLPGVRVHDGQQTRGARPAVPFSEFKDGRCIRHKHWLEDEAAEDTDE